MKRLINKLQRSLCRALPIMLSVLLILGSFPVFAVPSSAGDENAQAYPDGALLIGSEEELLAFVQNCSLDSYSKGLKVFLTQNITLHAADFSGIPYFAGEFDGGDHVIDGVSLAAGGSTRGFFRYVAQGAVVKNLTVRGVICPQGTKATVGGIAADNSGTLLNCRFNGKIEGKSDVGGIAGINQSTGQIENCAAWGTVTGEYRTGGICGENLGTITESTNHARVNTVEVEVTFDVSDFDIRNITDADTNITCTDTGGVAGYSSGIIRSCNNRGTVGYAHTGYNVGGIAGRQSGFMTGCNNYGSVCGRKDIAGIVGQAEPYVALTYNQSILNDIFDEFDNLQGLLGDMLDHNTNLPTDISNHLNALGDSLTGAKDDTKELIDTVSGWGDESIDTVNDAMNRVSFVIDNVSPMVTDLQVGLNKLSRACDYLDNALVNAEEAVRILSDSTELENALDSLKNVSTEAQSALTDLSSAMNALNSALGDTSKTGEALDDITTALKALSKALSKIDASITKIADLIEIPDLSGLTAEEALNMDISSVTDDFKAFKREFKNIAQNVSKANDALTMILDGVSVITGELDPKLLSTALTTTSRAFNTLAGTADDINASLDSMIAFCGDLKNAGGAITDAAEEMQSVTEEFKGAFDWFSKASDRLKNTADELSAMPELSFSKIGDKVTSTSDSLNQTVTEMQNTLSSLNSLVTDSSDVFVSDLKGINGKFSDIITLFRKANDDAAADKTVDDVYEDISESDTESSNATGKVSKCINYGTIEGDVNIGGIAGAMAIERDFDPEDDLQKFGNRSTDFVFRTRTVLRDCENRGDITSKKNAVGSIVGRMDLGTVISCDAYGSVTSTGGDYVGGIAGISYTSILACHAKATLSGRRYVGGIAGKAHDVKKCISVPAVDKGEQFVGAVVGDADGDIVSNRFVSRELAGWDGVSYAGKAEPMSYEALKNETNLSENMTTETAVFRAEDTVVARVVYTYGEPIPADKIPPVPDKSGYEGHWQYEGEALTYGRTIEAEYLPYVTALAVGSDGTLPTTLLDGSFNQTAHAEIVAFGGSTAGLPDSALYAYTITVGDAVCGTDAFRVHIAKPEDFSKTAVYVSDGTKWELVDSSEDGSYLVFDAAGESVTFALVKATDYQLLNLLVGLAALLVLVVIVAVARKKHKKGKSQKSQKSKKGKKAKKKQKPSEVSEENVFE